MALKARLELRQSQSLVMTPQLQQAIKLLQMSNMELNEFVETELETNPLLEREDVPSDIAPAETPPEPQAEVAAGTDGDDGPELGLELGDESAGASSFEQLDTEYDNVYSDESKAEAQVRSTEAPGGESGWSSLRENKMSGWDGGDFDLEATLTREKTLSEHLTEQLNLTIKDPAARLIGIHLIGMINETGYLTADLDQVVDQLGAAEADVRAVLQQMQQFDPPGIFARDLAECLSLQLVQQDRLDPAMESLVVNLELLAKRDYSALKRLCGVDEEDLLDMMAEIRNLNPRPGNAFGAVVVHPVVPDVFVREANDGGWMVELNTETLPKVLINNAYYGTVHGTATKDEDKTYISECYSNANWLVKSLDQRARTILKVSREIVRQQDAFFAYGIQHLKPLNLKTIADEIEMHESTVSRVTSNKYMATPRGIFEMKYFFTSAINSSVGGEAFASESVRHRIRELIDAEPPAKVLSDDKIVDILRQGGMDIARRTVAKYREAMGIPSSVQRRREKREMA